MSRTSVLVEILVLIVVPAVLFACAFVQPNQSGIITFAVAVGAVVAFFALFELSHPPLRAIMPTVVLAALAAAGRILFAPFADVKPVTAIAIMAGVVFGRRCGFMVGALAALVSNFFFGQGAWTPFQMYAWGLAGYLGGVLAQKGAFDWHPVIAGRPRTSPWLYVYGFLACLLYGLILNSWYLVGWIHPITVESSVLVFAAGLPLDLVHASATVVFLAILYAPWRRKLERIKRKYALAA